MKILKRILCIFLSVLIIFFCVNNSYFTTVKMDNVEAAETIVITGEIARLICEYFGAVTYGYASADKAKPNITTDDLAKVGHEFIKKIYEENGLPGEIADVQKELIENKNALGMLSYAGQAYVFGSEALQEVAGMDFSVINGGGGDDEDPDEESKIKKFAKSAFSLTMAGTLAISQVLPLVATELMNENPTEYEQNNPEYMFTGFEDSYIPDAQQYNIKAYSYSTATASYQGLEDIHIYTFQSMKSERVHIIYTSSGYMFCLDNGASVNISCSIKWHHKYNDWKTWNTSSWLMSYVPPNHNCTFSANIPIYPSSEAWEEAMQSGDYTGALNYNRVYPIADWLKDDWSGVLYDPLTGLNTGLDWFNLIRQGLASSALADSTGKSYRNGIRDYFKEANENRDESNLPYIDPGLSPIYLPSTMPGVSIDPDSDVAVKPGTNSEPFSPIEPVPVPDNAKDLNENLNNVAVYVPTLADSLTDMGDGLKKKFPFSIPWDVHYILSGLATTPKAPRFELPLKVERYGINETIVVDMARFQVLSDLSRSIFSLLFAMVLINLTIKVIGSLKEE